MVKVDFFIVGQPKSGTTALAQFLSEHPGVALSLPKEPEYFATDLHRESDQFYGSQKYMMIRTPSDYDRCYAHAEDGQIIGDASATYLRSKEAAKNIYAHNPHAKIIMMLRNPIDFAYSMHMQYVNSAIETEEDFEVALSLEDERKRGRGIPKKARYPSALFYTEQAKYHDQVKRFLDIFPQESILIFTQEQFKSDNVGVFRDVVNLLGVDDTFRADFKEVHKSKAPRFKVANQLMHTPFVWKTMHRLLPPRIFTKVSSIAHRIILKEQPRKNIDSGLRERLRLQLIEDVKKTGKLIDRDLVEEWRFNESTL